jgi:high-affinity nickel permease
MAKHVSVMSRLLRQIKRLIAVGLFMSLGSNAVATHHCVYVRSVHGCDGL